VNISTSTKILLDANVYYAAAKSSTGGSVLILEFARKKNFTIVTTKHILKEAERNLRNKESLQVLLQHYENLKSIKLKKIEIDTQKAVIALKNIINPKDALVLYAAQKARVNFLLTLDKKHFFNPKIKSQKIPFKILTPGDFIQNHLLD